jgi:hypothetical protein
MSKNKGAAHRSRLCSFPIVPAGLAFPDGSFISTVLEPREQEEAVLAQKTRAGATPSARFCFCA